MPEFLEQKLSKEYGGNKHAIYGTMNKIGAMRGNKETAKGAAMQAKHDSDTAAKRARKPAKTPNLAAKIGKQMMEA